MRWQIIVVNVFLYHIENDKTDSLSSFSHFSYCILQAHKTKEKKIYIEKLQR